MSGPTYRLGVDIGGTFTDATLIDESTGEISICKVPSTPADPSRGFMNAARRILRDAGVPASGVRFVVHGTTVATNAIIERQTARTGFVTTEGFSDMLEIARQTRPELYNLLFEKPPPLVPRYLCYGVPERLDARGEVVLPIDEDAVRVVAQRLGDEGVEAVAVCFLHSYVNAAHEKIAGEVLRAALPGVAITLSAELAPEIREYFRASTTVVNASITPIVASYLQGIEARLREDGVEAELLVMQSNGGVFTFDAARDRPVFMVESGPAAGVIAAAYLGEALGLRNVISFDMGGTTAKAGLIQDGEPAVTKDYEVGTAARSGAGASRGSGYPIRTPVIDLVEIGAGGGSIAWVDSGGALRVGPRSAGAEPGPACYGRGGSEPTVTDANLVLGRLNPEYFLGGEVVLDLGLAERAVRARCAEPLGMDLAEAALGIVEIANAAMVNSLRLISVRRGHDPRDYSLIAFGGAGPVHACRLAAEMEIPTTVVPASPGTASAMGLLVTDLTHEYASTLIRRADAVAVREVEETFGRLEKEGREALQRDGVVPEAMSFVRQVDMRYAGQSYELTVSAPAGEIGPAGLEAMVDRFHSAHERAYGHSTAEEPVELVNLRVSAIGRISKPALRRLGEASGGRDAALKPGRLVYFAEAGGVVDTPVYDRYLLGAGVTVPGPAVIEEMDSTTVVHPGWRADVDGFGNLLLSAGGRRG